jgi:shikimate kinase
MDSSITLIGMPSAGKTSVGKNLHSKLVIKNPMAKIEFLDLDNLVEQKENQTLIDILETKGGDFFLKIQSDMLKSLDPSQFFIISPAGSIIYNKEAMNWIKKNTTIIFLDTEIDVIRERLKKAPKAIAELKEKGLDLLFSERRPVYAKWADVTILTGNDKVTNITQKIINKLKDEKERK